MILALAVSGMAALSLGMARHYGQAFGGEPPPRRGALLKGAGWVLVLAALAPAVNTDGISVGITLWAVALTFAALGIALVHSYAPRLVAPLGLIAVAVAAMHAIL